MPRFLPLLLAALASSASLAQTPNKHCRLEAIEEGSRWPVPLVQFRTTHQRRFVTDNAGLVAIDDPDLMGREVFLHVDGHGYEVARDGFGFRGVRITPEPGKTIRISLKRTIIAKRLGRLTGGGLFAHSQRLGEAQDWRESGVVGSDSVQSAIHGGKRYWLWGDTSLLHYPLGVFHSTSATTPVDLWPPDSLGKPPLRVAYDYFRDVKTKRPRAVAALPGSGPTWLSGYTSLPDDRGSHRLVALYAKIKPPLEAYERGLCVWNEEQRSFERLRVLWNRDQDAGEPPEVMPQGHPAFWTDDTGQRWVYYGNPFPTMRCRAAFSAWSNPDQWEPVKRQQTVARAGGDDDERSVRPHSGAIAWSASRQRWVSVFMEAFGKPSAFGELWYCEANSPIGPWGPAVKILSHKNYTFYNPKIHQQLAPSDAPVLFFEGTYTQQFANKPLPTARYDYNQVLYRLDLDDPRLAPAQAAPGR